MEFDFHYYATFCASKIAGYTNIEAKKIAYSACFVDFCTATLLKKCNISTSAATTQSVFELADYTTDIVGLKEITRVWASFHFLPGDLYAPIKKGGRNYKSKYRLICKPNGKLIIDTINIAKDGSLEGIGIAMHVLADSWAHQNFVGTASLAINDVNSHIYEIYEGKDYHINFSPNPARSQNIEEHKYLNSMYVPNENSVMNIGHGRLGHIADLSYIKFRYMPAWNGYNEIIKDNPSDFMKAFTQMVYALKYLRGEIKEFELNKYDSCDEYKDRVYKIINKRQLSAINDWKEYAYELAGEKIDDFDVNKFPEDYLKAKDKENTEFNSFVKHALKHKSLITSRICESKNKLAGYSINYQGTLLKGLSNYVEKIEHKVKARRNNKLNFLFKNIKNVALLIIGALILGLPSPTDYLLVCLILGSIITLLGLKKLFYYLTSARLMIGGTKIFVNSFLMMDLGLLSFLLLLENISLGMLYMAAILCIYGFIDVFRAIELKRYRYKTWALKILKGLLKIAIGTLCVIFVKEEALVLFVFSVTCIILAIGGIVTSFTKYSDDYTPSV